MGLERHEVIRTDRIKVTENLIRGANARNVLEIGAGDYSFAYCKEGSGASWVKVDFSPPCDVICDFNANNEAVLPFAGEQFDLIVCTQVLEHLLWPQQVLKEAYRVLARGGGIVVSIPNIASLSYRIAWLMGRVPSCAASGNLPPEFGSTAYRKEDGALVGGHVVDFNLARIVGLLDYSGFKIARIEGSGIIWHKQLLPHWSVPPSLASNIICLARK